MPERVSFFYLMGSGSSRYTSGSSSSDTIILDEPVSSSKNNISSDIEFQEKLQKLITFSQSSDPVLQRKVAECLANEAMSEERRTLIVQLGGLNLLYSLIHSKDIEIQRLAMHSLANLAVSDSNQKEIAKNLDLVHAIVSLLGSPHIATQRQAAKALANLAVRVENKNLLAKCNVIPPLLSLASLRGITQVQTEALAAIANLSVDDTNEILIGETFHGIKTILTILCESLDEEVLAQGVRAIRNLSINIRNKDLIKKYNGIAILTNLTLSTCDRIRNQALISLQSITTLY